jgi:hypothetical protein
MEQCRMSVMLAQTHRAGPIVELSALGARSFGSLQRIDGGPSHARWSWSITAVYFPPSTISSRGTADSKEDAKAAFAKTFRDWLNHVGADDLTEEVLAKHRIGSRR